jgi:hypothetical protein
MHEERKKVADDVVKEIKLTLQIHPATTKLWFIKVRAMGRGRAERWRHY